MPSIYTFIVTFPFPLTLTCLSVTFSFTFSSVTVSPSTVTFNWIVFGVLSTSTSFGYVVLVVSPFTLSVTGFLILSWYPVIDFTFIVTVPVFVSAILFTVKVIVEPSSTVSPDFILWFKTTPLSFVLSSVYSISTTKPFSSKDFFAVSTSFCNTDVTTTCFIPVPMLIYTFTVSPAFTSVPSSVSCFVIYPDSIVLLVSSTNSSFNLASFADFSASSFVVPTNFGTLVFSVPKLTITLISDFSFTVHFEYILDFVKLFFLLLHLHYISASPSEYTNFTILN